MQACAASSSPLWHPVQVLVALAAVSLPAVAGEPWTDDAIVQAVHRGCDRAERFELYRGADGNFDFPGPLYLARTGARNAHGVLLTPYLRLYLMGRSRGCKAIDLEEARKLAAPEVWAVLWRFEDPPRPYSSRTFHDQRVLYPTDVVWRVDGQRLDPLWTRASDRHLERWFPADWNQRESLVAAFTIPQGRGSVVVDYRIEEDGRSYLTETLHFSLGWIRPRWWEAAFGND